MKNLSYKSLLVVVLLHLVGVFGAFHMSGQKQLKVESKSDISGSDDKLVDDSFSEEPQNEFLKETEISEDDYSVLISVDDEIYKSTILGQKTLLTKEEKDYLRKETSGFFSNASRIRLQSRKLSKPADLSSYQFKSDEGYGTYLTVNGVKQEVINAASIKGTHEWYPVAWSQDFTKIYLHHGDMEFSFGGLWVYDIQAQTWTKVDLPEEDKIIVAGNYHMFVTPDFKYLTYHLTDAVDDHLHATANQIIVYDLETSQYWTLYESYGVHMIGITDHNLEGFIKNAATKVSGFSFKSSTIPVNYKLPYDDRMYVTRDGRPDEYAVGDLGLDESTWGSELSVRGYDDRCSNLSCRWGFGEDPTTCASEDFATDSEVCIGLNCDLDGDGDCDVNCDTNGDGKCDLNCDTDGNGSPDLNIDNDDDGECDENCHNSDYHLHMCNCSQFEGPEYTGSTLCSDGAHNYLAIDFGNNNVTKLNADGAIYVSDVARVLACADGVVIKKGVEAFCGETVKIQHADGTSITYCHMINGTYGPGIELGACVVQGQFIGEEGNTGTTSTHVHIQQRTNVDDDIWFEATEYGGCTPHQNFIYNSENVEVTDAQYDNAQFCGVSTETLTTIDCGGDGYDGNTSNGSYSNTFYAFGSPSMKTGPEQVFEFTVSESQDITVTLTQTSSSYDLDFYIMTSLQANDASSFIASNNEGGLETSHTFNHSGGQETYYVVVDAWNFEYGPYNLLVEANCVEDDPDPNPEPACIILDEETGEYVEADGETCGVDFSEVSIVGLEVTDEGELQFLFEAIEADSIQTAIDIDAQVDSLQKMFLQALSIPTWKWFISMDLLPDGNGWYVGDARTESPFEDTDIARHFFQADVQLKYDLFTENLQGEDASEALWSIWSDMLEASPNASYYEDYGFILPGWRLRGAFEHEYVQANLETDQIVVTDAMIYVDREVVEIYPPSLEDHPSYIQDDLNLMLDSWSDSVQTRLDNSADILTDLANGNTQRYCHLRALHKMCALASWYKSLSISEKPYADLIDSENLDGIWADPPFNEAYWDSLSLHLMDTVLFSYFDYGTFTTHTWGGVSMGSSTPSNTGPITNQQLDVDSLVFQGGNTVIVGNKHYFGRVENPEPFVQITSPAQDTIVTVTSMTIEGLVIDSQFGILPESAYSWETQNDGIIDGQSSVTVDITPGTNLFVLTGTNPMGFAATDSVYIYFEPVYGCTDLVACNFDSLADIPDGSCVYPPDFHDCLDNCLNDQDGDGVCDELEIVGCQDMAACDYDIVATDSGSCQYLDCLGVCGGVAVNGCGDTEACNYNPEVDCFSGECLYGGTGCTNPGACNYDSTVVCDDGSCVVSFYENALDESLGGTSGDQVYDVVAANSGNDVFILGTSESNMSATKSENHLGGGDYWLVSMDENLMTNWDRTLGGSGTEHARKVLQKLDGSVLVLGHSESDISEFKSENAIEDLYDYWAICMSSDGQTRLWDNTIGSSSSDFLVDGLLLPDGSYLLGGYSAGPVSYDKTSISESTDFWIVHLSSDGQTVLSDASFGGPGGQYFTAMALTPTGEVILGGYPIAASPDYRIIKIANDYETVLWDISVGGDGDDYLRDLTVAPDGTIYVLGDSNSNSSGAKSEDAIGGSIDYWLLVLTGADGSILWDKTVGGTGVEEASSIEILDNQILLTGKSTSNISGDKTEDAIGSGYDYWIACIDADTHSVLWDNTVGANSYETTPYSDVVGGKIVLAGGSQSGVFADKTDPEIGGTDYWVIKLEEEIPILGCTDAAACNFNSDAECDDSSCVYLETFYDCGGNCLADVDGDGVCDELEITGCQNSLACNYDPTATDEAECLFLDCDGVCGGDATEGCTNNLACNFDPNATCDDESCLLGFEGCTDPLACNYIEIAVCDNGTCNYDYGCTNPLACNFDPTAQCNDDSCLFLDCDGICGGDVTGCEGCMDSVACNYDPAATISTFTCTYSQTYYDCDGNCLSDVDGDGICDEIEIIGCQDTAACNFDAEATDQDVCLFLDCLGICGGIATEGCMDSTASNYNAEALCDNGSCLYDISGCTNPEASNYDSDATISDGSCVGCPGDLDLDGDINTADLLIFLSVLGTNVEPGIPGDMNSDGVVDTTDMLAMLSIFGTFCD